MNNQQDFVLNLVAELDEGNVQSQAAQIANSITSTMQQAFEGLGQKIADAIMRGSQAGVGGIVDQYGRGMSPATAQFPQAQPGAPGGGAPVMPPPPTNPLGNPLNNFNGGYHSSYLDIHAFPAQAGANIRNQIQRDILGGGGGGSNGGIGWESDPQALHTDIAYQRARQIKAMRDAGMQVSLSDEEKSMFEGARTSGQASLSANREEAKKLGEEIERLNKGIVELQKAMNESARATDQERTDRGLKSPEAIKAEQDAERARLDRLKTELGQLSSVSGTEASRIKELGGVLSGGGGGFDYGRALGIAAPVSMALAQAPGMFRGAAVASAGIENLESRSLAGGDIERLMAVNRLGGMDSLRMRGGLEAAGLAGATMLGSIGSFALGGPMGMMAGAGLGVSAFNQITGFESGRRNAIESRISSEMSQNSELYDVNRAGRQTSAAAFSNAQSLGDVGLSDFLNGNVSRRSMSTQLDMMPRQWAAEDNALRAAGHTVGGNTAARRAAFAQMSGQLVNTGNSLDIDGMSYNQYGISRGLVGEGQVQSTLASLAGNVGGSFNGQRSLLQNPNMIRNLLDTQAAGLSNTTGLMGMMQAGSDANTNMRGENAQTIKDLFENAVSAGLDKARVGQALMTVAAQNTGMGAARMNDFMTNQGLGVAQRLFGQGGIEGAEMDFTQRAISSFTSAAQGDGGLGGIAGIRAAKGTMNKFGLKGGQGKEMLLANFTGDPAGIAKEFGVSMEQAEQISEYLQQSKVSEMDAVAGQAGYSGDLKKIVAGKTAGAGTLSEVQAAQGVLDTFKDANGQPIRPDTLESLAPGQYGPPNKRFTTEKGIQEGLQQRGVDQAQALAGVNAEQISAGLISLGTNARAASEAFEKLVTRIQQVLNSQVSTPLFTPSMTKAAPPGK